MSGQSRSARRNASRHVERRSSLQSSGQVATPASSSGFATPHSSSHGHPQAATAPAQPARAAPSSRDHAPRSATTSEFWDWENAIDFTDVADFYEPQGELSRAQYQPPGQDFSFPHAISASDPSLSVNSPLLTPAAGSPFLDAQPAPLRFSALPSAFPPPPARGSTSASAQSVMKRKDRSESASIGSSAALPYGNDAVQEPVAKRTATSRSSSVADESPTVTQAASFVNTSGGSPEPLGNAARSTTVTFAGQPAGQAALAGAANASNATQTAAARSRRIAEIGNKYSAILPAGKVFPIQIGNELFRLSGASISSDAPSYFSHFFAEQLYNNPSGRAGDVKTLYIDRDPATFRDISLHLQGYFVRPRDGEHFVRLFADAQFYSLPRLTQQLFKSEIFIQIGGRDFQIPRDLFSGPGDSPNFFSLGFAHFFTTPQEVFPGLDRQTLLRPPSILPPSVPNRSGDTFADLLRLLQGYPLHVRDEGHRADLIRDARYFHFKGLEQKLLPCEIMYNLAREKSEILMRLDDIRQSGVSFASDVDSGAESSSSAAATPAAGPPPSVGGSPRAGWVTYARPYADESTHELILEISGESARIDIQAMRIAFYGDTKARIASLFQVIASKMGLPATQPLGLMMMQTGGGVAAQPASPANSGVSGDRVKVAIGPDASISLDRLPLHVDRREREVGLPTDPQSSLFAHLMRSNADGKIGMGDESATEWIVAKGQWRLRVQPTRYEGESRVEVVMHAVKLDAYTGERARNDRRGFLA
ncbi:hypothetical protein B0J12DRAFT_656005 [Macrophomina phaseolina]|uniref:Potassium channel tetramerisation-type BTB domain-containing protein n=1 Tax=Macrophomina phaseolina TaxID=35725 RepID=A0ABQ8GHF9_9PEZI|nr:hypothetical protein B0J12DRAFT_656005 [Macrophomina phaseolina]